MKKSLITHYFPQNQISPTKNPDFVTRNLTKSGMFFIPNIGYDITGDTGMCCHEASEVGSEIVTVSGLICSTRPLTKYCATATSLLCITYQFLG